MDKYKIDDVNDFSSIYADGETMFVSVFGLLAFGVLNHLVIATFPIKF